MNMIFLLAAGFGQALAGLLIFLMSSFVVMLVLVQRGRGGGLAGAFGGMGGQSAFGAKAGDTFTKITVISATLWILLCVVSVRFLGNSTAGSSVFDGDESSMSDLEQDLADDRTAGEGDTESLLDNAVEESTEDAETTSLLDNAVEEATEDAEVGSGSEGDGSASEAASDESSSGDS